MTRAAARFVSAAAAAAVLAVFSASCTPPAPGKATAEAAKATVAGGCAASAARSWTADGVTYAVTIAATGASCATAQATLKVTAPDGAVVHEETLEAATTFELRDAATPEAMKLALASALSAGDEMNATDALPEWVADADSPGGEFPFVPEDGVDRAAYQKLRAGKVAMLCYVQGGESLGCWRLDGRRMVKIGAQTFPG